MADLFDKIKPIFDSFGVPEYIWKPAARKESGLNPYALNDNGKELSKGIFQINVMAHPQYAAYDLYDAETNAEIAARDFIAPAYNYARTITTDPELQALIVYSGLKNPYNPKEGYIPNGAGIRPKWTKSTMDTFLNYYKQYAPTSATPSMSDPSMKEVQSSTGTPTEVPDLNFIEGTVSVGLTIGLIVVMIAAFFYLLKESNTGSGLINIVKKTVKGVSS